MQPPSCYAIPKAGGRYEFAPAVGKRYVPGGADSPLCLFLIRRFSHRIQHVPCACPTAQARDRPSGAEAALGARVSAIGARCTVVGMMYMCEKTHLLAMGQDPVNEPRVPSPMAGMAPSGVRG